MRDVTVKDVLYALEYMHDAMVRVPIRDGKARWQMKVGGQPVKDSVANEVRNSRFVVGIEDMGRQLIVWRAAA